MANAFYAQSGGVTSVINATACGLIEAVRSHETGIVNLLAGRNGILGALHEQLIDCTSMSDAQVAALRYTPSGAFGSCRFKLGSVEDNPALYERILEVFKAHRIEYFFYNGGGDSQDTTLNLSRYAESVGYPLQCLGLPKTIDNDLPFTDNCPGFGSAAKYLATSIREASLDVAAMAASSTKVFLLEAMGRHTGWLAAATGCAREQSGDAPHLILLPEMAWELDSFLDQVEQTVRHHGHAAIVVSEGVKFKQTHLSRNSNERDAFGHVQLGGVVPHLAESIKQNLGFKYHWAIPDYLQRSGRHLAARVDVEQAYALGQAAVKLAHAGESGCMLTLERISSQPYRWRVGRVPLADVANVEKPLPHDFFDEAAFSITEQARRYFTPLMEGEEHPPYRNGLPDYLRWQPTCLQPRCPPLTSKDIPSACSMC